MEELQQENQQLKVSIESMKSLIDEQSKTIYTLTMAFSKVNGDAQANIIKLMNENKKLKQENEKLNDVLKDIKVVKLDD